MEDDALVQENLDLIDTVAWDVVRKCHVPERGFDDVWSASGLALVLAARKYDPERGDPRFVRRFLRKKMFYLVIDELRLLNGRKLVNGGPGGQYEMNRRTVSLNRHASGEDNGSNETEMVDLVEDDHARIDFEKIGDLDEIREFLDSLPSDRYREIALRLISGETRKAVGERFGITESRVSQIATKIGQVRYGGDDYGTREESEWAARSGSLNVNWR